MNYDYCNQDYGLWFMDQVFGSLDYYGWLWLVKVRNPYLIL